ncbi:hypothetical protein NE237_015495 [Protea cynaroides]|uniref:Uncharacterized protein n=1 Tax=Protea cynaroides TaxID=273540 RepID=A0A9Q0KE63_9MAGN|nr:hypothetical protein NE237_015495 [Protea cynaroides]
MGLFVWELYILETYFNLGRNITVKVADTQKGKVVQTLPAAMVPITIPLQAGYAQQGKAHINAANVGYSAYPPSVAAYPSTAYPDHAAASAALYAPQTQISYAQVAVKKEPVEFSTGAPAGVSTWPYYIPRQ